MGPDITYSLEEQFKDLPYARIVHPTSLFDWIKYIFWRFYTPFHPFVRDITLALGIFHHTGRQNFLIGKVAPEHSLEEVVNFLVARGYGNHFIAWKDDGELVSLRRVVDFKYQYHIRIFSDGEIRGHYEYTPEARPFLHFRAIGQENCSQEFVGMLGGLIVSSS